jgi:hypothetical protein
LIRAAALCVFSAKPRKLRLPALRRAKSGGRQEIGAPTIAVDNLPSIVDPNGGAVAIEEAAIGAVEPACVCDALPLDG